MVNRKGEEWGGKEGGKEDNWGGGGGMYEPEIGRLPVYRSG